jgi:hypothetical protein
MGFPLEVVPILAGYGESSRVLGTSPEGVDQNNHHLRQC